MRNTEFPTGLSQTAGKNNVGDDHCGDIVNSACRDFAAFLILVVGLTARRERAHKTAGL
ncbi:MAG: hypothetical protein PUC36_00745 [Clostridiales bacterium]|nr:hypothetical protein [Clostridiales bacterium]